MSQLSFRLFSLSIIFTMVGSCGRDSENPMVRTFSIRPAGPCEEVHAVLNIALSNHYSRNFSDFEYLYPRAIQASLTAFEGAQPDLSNLSIWYQSKKAIIAQAMESPEKDIQQCSSIEKIAELVDRIESERLLGNLRISPTQAWSRFHENRSDAQVYRVFLTTFAKVLDPYSSYARSLSSDSYGFGIRTDAEFALSLGLTGKEVKSLNILGLRRPRWSLGQNLRSEQSTTSGVELKLRDEIIALKPGIEEWKYLPRKLTRDQKDPTWIAVGEFFDHEAVSDLLGFFNSNEDPELNLRIKRGAEVHEISIEGMLNSSVVDNEPLVSAEILNNEFFYLRLFEFGDGASLQLAQAFEEIKLQWMQQNTPEKQPKIILDLRFNPGGSIIEAQRIAQFFMKTGPMFQSHTREEEDFKLQTISALSSHTPTSYPMVVLINHLSASASELLTQALQESNRAWIVGQKSFGKGIGQTAIELGAASSLGGRFWLTHLVFYGLSGQTVQPKGLEPDLVIIDEKVERFRNECESKKRQCRSQSMSASLKQIAEQERISPQTIPAHPEYKGQRDLQAIHALKDSLSAEVQGELDPQLTVAQRLLQQSSVLTSPE